jgi:hypothetical protein
VKEYLWGKRFKLEMMPTSLSLPLYIIWARMYIKLHFIYHTDRKSVWTVLVIRGCMCKHSGIWSGVDSADEEGWLLDNHFSTQSNYNNI